MLTIDGTLLRVLRLETAGVHVHVYGSRFTIHIYQMKRSGEMKTGTRHLLPRAGYREEKK